MTSTSDRSRYTFTQEKEITLREYRRTAHPHLEVAITRIMGWLRETPNNMHLIMGVTEEVTQIQIKDPLPLVQLLIYDMKVPIIELNIQQS